MSRPYSSAYADAVIGGAEMVTVIQVIDPAGRILSTTSKDLLVASGSVTADATSTFRRSLSNLVLLDPDGALLPTSSRDLFSPTSSNELQIYSGYQTPAGPEVFPAGRFRITGAVVADVPQGITISITGSDRASIIADNKYEKPYVVQKDQPIEVAIANILLDRLPPQVRGDMWVISSGFTVPERLVFALDSDPWAQVVALGLSVGVEVFFGPRGVPVIRPIPDPMDRTAQPSWIYRDGETSTMTKLSREQNSTDSPSGIHVEGQGSTPPHAIVWDDNPNSPTYYLGPYGKRLKKITDSRVKTNGQALAAAKGYLRRDLGTAEMVKLSVIPNPNIEPGDIIRVIRGSSKLNDSLFVDSFTLPLQVTGGPTMDITCRLRRL